MQLIFATDDGEIVETIPGDEIGNLDHPSGIARAVFLADVLETAQRCMALEQK